MHVFGVKRRVLSAISRAHVLTKFLVAQPTSFLGNLRPIREEFPRRCYNTLQKPALTFKGHFPAACQRILEIFLEILSGSIVVFGFCTFEKNGHVCRNTQTESNFNLRLALTQL